MYKKNEIIKIMERVNDYRIGECPDVGDCSWERATYMLGNMAAYEAAGNKKYLDYALKWAEENKWRFYQDDKSDYRFTTCADYVLCGEIYYKLMEYIPGCGTEEYMIESMENTINDPNNDYWWWVDTIHMALPIYNIMGLKFNDERYFDKVNRLFNNSRTERRCYDEEEHLWFRDERFLFENQQTMSGKKVFWSRGNGWVFAGLARTLMLIDESNKYYKEYADMFKDMAESISKCISDDGFFRTSLLEPSEYDMPETSGTALFAIGYLLGVKRGILDKKYLDVAFKAFDGLTKEALEESGKIGWVQTIADCPGVVKKDCTNDYAYGTYLQICKEMLEYCED